MATGQWTSVRHYLHRLAEPVLTDAELLGRFRASGDEAAFEALVHRHGPLVQGVCRRVLRDWHAAQDAFQAVFLILARKAVTLQRPDTLGPWLYAVAYRTAQKARVQMARRSARETWHTSDVATADSTEEVDWRDLRPVLDAEINRLPARYRKPFVLSYLQGKTNAEVARLLGCSRGTVATLLARARQRLRQRLTQRGLTLSAALTVSSVPAALSVSTARAAILFAAGHLDAASGLRLPAATLAQGVLRAMITGKVKSGMIAFLAISVLGMGAGIATYRAGADEPIRMAAPNVPAQVVAAPPAPPVAAAVYGTVDFDVTAPSIDIARRIGHAAQQQRDSLALAWLGNGLPHWSKPCPIHVKLTAQGCGGATSFAFDHGNVIGRDMHLEGNLQGILADALPHEITHTILADHFGKPLPRWADEGAAILAESDSSRERQAAILGELLKSSRRIPLSKLLSLRDFPQDVMALYVEGYSLTRFLIRNDRATFLTFIAQGEKDGWDKAARDCYGYASIDELEKTWLRQARKDLPRHVPLIGTGSPSDTRRVVAASDDVHQPHGQLPAGPAPVQALVTLDEHGQLNVWLTALAYVPQTTYAYTERQNTAGGTNRAVVPVTTYKAVTRWFLTRHRLKDVKVYDNRARPVDIGTLKRRLKEETLALVATGGERIDPLHFRLIKPGTLVFVVPSTQLEPVLQPPVATMAPTVKP